MAATPKELLERFNAAEELIRANDTVVLATSYALTRPQLVSVTDIRRLASAQDRYDAATHTVRRWQAVG